MSTRAHLYITDHETGRDRYVESGDLLSLIAKAYDLIKSGRDAWTRLDAPFQPSEATPTPRTEATPSPEQKMREVLQDTLASHTSFSLWPLPHARNCINALVEALQSSGCLKVEVTGETSDGYHTFNELYAHRCTLFLALLRSHPSLSWISTKHADDSTFGDWFIAGMRLPTGDVTYHLPARLWSLACATGAEVRERGYEWDGHTSADVVNRIQEWIAIPPTSHQPAPERILEVALAAGDHEPGITAPISSAPDGAGTPK